MTKAIRSSIRDMLGNDLSIFSEQHLKRELKKAHEALLYASELTRHIHSSTAYLPDEAYPKSFSRVPWINFIKGAGSEFVADEYLLTACFQYKFLKLKAVYGKAFQIEPTDLFFYLVKEVQEIVKKSK